MQTKQEASAQPTPIKLQATPGRRPGGSGGEQARMVQEEVPPEVGKCEESPLSRVAPWAAAACRSRVLGKPAEPELEKGPGREER